MVVPTIRTMSRIVLTAGIDIFKNRDFFTFPDINDITTSLKIISYNSNFSKVCQYIFLAPAARKTHWIRWDLKMLDAATGRWQSCRVGQEMKKYAIINPDAGPGILRGLMRCGLEPILVEKTDLTSEPLAGHADLQVFLCGERIFCHPGIGKNFLKKMGGLMEVVICSTPLSPRYPGDIAYNVADTGSAAILAVKHTDRTVRELLADAGRRLIPVRQGYARCSTAIVDENSIMTSDEGIHRRCGESGLESLLISPGHIDLPGYGHGFIGGATGNDGNKILFTGDFSHHPHYRHIMEFLEMQGRKAVILSDTELSTWAPSWSLRHEGLSQTFLT